MTRDRAGPSETPDPAVLSVGLLRDAGLLVDAAGDRAELGGVRLAVVAVGWATVELERAMSMLGAATDSDAADRSRPEVSDPVADDLLGATGRIVGGLGGGPRLVVLEPATEGRLAATLARRGEGPAVLYLVAVGIPGSVAGDRLAGAGIRTRSGRSAFGPSAVVLGRPRDGPQLVLVAVPSGP